MMLGAARSRVSIMADFRKALQTGDHELVDKTLAELGLHVDERTRNLMVGPLKDSLSNCALIDMVKEVRGPTRGNSLKEEIKKAGGVRKVRSSAVRPPWEKPVPIKIPCRPVPEWRQRISKWWREIVKGPDQESK